MSARSLPFRQTGPGKWVCVSSSWMWNSPFLLQEALRLLKILQNLDPPICI